MFFVCTAHIKCMRVALRSLSLAVSAYSPTPGRHDSRWRSKSFALQPCWSTAAADHKTGGKIFNYYSKSITVCVRTVVTVAVVCVHTYFNNKSISNRVAAARLCKYYECNILCCSRCLRDISSAWRCGVGRHSKHTLSIGGGGVWDVCQLRCEMAFRHMPALSAFTILFFCCNFSGEWGQISGVLRWRSGP